MPQLPELFGSSYITLAIIVVVVLLLVLLLFLNMRGRKRAGAGAAATAGQSGKRTKPPKERLTKGRVAAAAAAAASTAESPDSVEEGPEATAEAEETAPSHAKLDTARQTRADLGAGGMPAADPITTVVNDILRGWGDLTDEDTNRLTVFRQDRVLAAIAAAGLPKDLKNSEHARTRLGQLRHYATTVQEGGRKVHLPQAEFAGIGVAPAGGPKPSGEPDGAQPTEPRGDAVEEIPEVEETAGEARAADASWGVDKSKSLWGEEAAVALWGTETPDTSQVTDAGGQSLPEIRWEPEAPKEMAEEAGTESGWGKENAVAAAAAAFWAASEPAEAPAAATTPAKAPTANETVTEEELPMVHDTFFSSLGGKVSTAADLLALPAGEQASMLVFLEPAELDKVFRAASDSELKKSVIDTLEHVGSPASLDVIQGCLEDPDPGVQVHALEAAERLLGAG
jgi:hypothetical protein